MKIDAAIDHYNENRNICQPKLDRLFLGRQIFPENSDSTINSVLSKWSYENYAPKPEPKQIVKIAQLTGVSLDFLFGLTLDPINPNRK